MRREIANSNERRRMQSINAGFQSLRSLLPKGECDKLSKAAILQGTVDYVQQLQQEKSFLLSQNIKLTRSVHNSNDSDDSDLPLPKRKKKKTELIQHLLDEGIGSASPSSQSETEDAARLEVAQLRQQLEHERAWRLRLEAELREREARLQAQSKVDHDYTGKTFIPTIHLNVQEHEIAHHPSTHLIASKPPILVKQEPRSDSSLNRPRQNLDTIVEAIRHIEGYHMFEDDSPLSSNATSPEPTDERTLQSQIISRAPVLQNRAGVIVSNMS